MMSEEEYEFWIDKDLYRDDFIDEDEENVE